ncbi:MAG: hypothetical protein HOO97_11935 [Sideroxydans sp.]|nr:hypothetical protein [Sideroxydans sp.]
MKSLMTSVILILGIVLSLLWSAQYFWIDKEQFLMPRMPSWKISILKVAHSLPWPASNEIRLNRTLKLSEAILHQQGDLSLNSLLPRFNESLTLLELDSRNHELTQHPDLAYKRLIQQVTLIHRGAYYLVKAGRQREIEEKFTQLEAAFLKLASPSMEDGIGFSLEKMLHEAIVNHDALLSKETKDGLLASLPVDSNAEFWRATVNLYYGYALCQSNNQDGADFIQASITYLPRNALIFMTASNWDVGLLGGIVLANQDGSACKNAVESVLSIMKSTRT